MRFTVTSQEISQSECAVHRLDEDWSKCWHPSVMPTDGNISQGFKQFGNACQHLAYIFGNVLF